MRLFADDAVTSVTSVPADVAAEPAQGGGTGTVQCRSGAEPALTGSVSAWRGHPVPTSDGEKPFMLERPSHLISPTGTRELSRFMEPEPLRPGLPDPGHIQTTAPGPGPV